MREITGNYYMRGLWVFFFFLVFVWLLEKERILGEGGPKMAEE